jgi:hypothetical protein
MRTTPLALGAALLLALACDPTQQHDYSCVRGFQGQSGACLQVHMTEAEGLVAEQACQGNDVGGTWAFHACPAELLGQARTPGYCVVEASHYSLSGGDATVFSYAPVDATAAAAACAEASGVWHP